MKSLILLFRVAVFLTYNLSYAVTIHAYYVMCNTTPYIVRYETLQASGYRPVWNVYDREGLFVRRAFGVYVSYLTGNLIVFFSPEEQATFVLW